MEFNKELKILVSIVGAFALLCIASLLFSFTKKEETSNKYQIERVYKDGSTFYVLVDTNGNPINFMYK